MRRLKFLVAMLAVLVGSVALFGSTRTASASPGDDFGHLTISGWVHLPSFPSNGEAGPVTAQFCANGVAHPSSGGPALVYTDGANTSTTQGVTTCAKGGPSLTATLTYNEPCPPAAGFAEGSLTLAGDPDIEYFAWTRTGANATLVLSDTVPPQSDPQGAGWLATADGSASATFEPVLGVGNTNCPGSPVNALVEGSGSWA